jgi:hypothetical protein
MRSPTLGRERPQTGVESLERAITIFPSYFAALQRLELYGLLRENMMRRCSCSLVPWRLTIRVSRLLVRLAYANFFDEKVPGFGGCVGKGRPFKAGFDVKQLLLLGMTQRILKTVTNAEKHCKKAAKLSEGLR